MPSPFPGMDPYLERPGTWPDFHSTYFHATRAELNRHLPSGYVARIERHVWLHEPSAEERLKPSRQDTYVAEQRDRSSAAVAVAELSAPLTFAAPIIEHDGHFFIRVMDLEGRRIVTVIELLSPSNKMSGPDRDAYIGKRNGFLGAKINLVEFDFLSSGHRSLAAAEAVPASDYSVVVAVASDLEHLKGWPISVRKPLPAIQVPLKPGDGFVSLALQPAFERAFADGQYEFEFDYDQPPAVPLTEPDATWARELLAARSAR